MTGQHVRQSEDNFVQSIAISDRPLSLILKPCTLYIAMVTLNSLWNFKHEIYLFNIYWVGMVSTCKYKYID